MFMANSRFQDYDYGSPQNNQAKYGQDSPPLIDLSKLVATPISLFVGKDDRMTLMDV